MTGNETIIIKGGEAVLGKVRHSGYDIVDFLTENKSAVLGMALDQVWPAYYSWRINGMSQDSLSAEIPTSFQTSGFKFSIPAGIDKKKEDDLIDSAQSHLAVLEKAKQAQDPNFNEGFLCGYSDYCVLINLDDQTITINGKDISKYEGDGDPDEDEEEDSDDSTEYAACTSYEELAALNKKKFEEMCNKRNFTKNS